jgi:hypothetical protein
MDDTGAPRDYDGQDPHVRHTPATNGYAKLVGIDFSFILRDKKVMLGRRMPQDRPGVLGISQSHLACRSKAVVCCQFVC